MRVSIRSMHYSNFLSFDIFAFSCSPNRWPTAATASAQTLLYRQIGAMDTFRSDRNSNSIVFMRVIGRNLSKPSAWTTGAMAKIIKMNSIERIRWNERTKKYESDSGGKLCKMINLNEFWNGTRAHVSHSGTVVHSTGGEYENRPNKSVSGRLTPRRVTRSLWVH